MAISAAPTDDLSTPLAPARVYYSLGRMLGVDDFRADQDYHRGRLARALLQLFGTGTVSGLNVSVPQIWQANASYPAFAFVYDENQNIHANTGVAGISGDTLPAFAANPGDSIPDGTGIVWTNESPLNANGWRPNSPFPVPSVIVDSNGNVQLLTIPLAWQANTTYLASSFVYDKKLNVQVNTGATGISGSTPPAFTTAVGDTVTDGTDIVWKNEGPVNAGGWQPNVPFPAPSVVVDTNGNVQILNGTSTFTTGTTPPVWSKVIGATTQDGATLVAAWTCAGPSQNVQLVDGDPTFTAGPRSPVWSTAIGSTTLDGSTGVAAWTCLGPSSLEIEVTPGVAVDRVGRIIDVPRTVCIRIQPWLANQSVSDLNSFLSSGNIMVDVFATFVPCTQGVTPCFATQDDYSATDAFSPNRLLDSFAMQLVLRTDATPRTPRDPWLPVGPMPSSAITEDIVKSLKLSILSAKPSASAPIEYPPGFDQTSVFLARILIPVTAGDPGQPPKYDLNAISIDNLSRLFLYPASLAARSMGLSSGKES
jgi:hypothetical protein